MAEFESCPLNMVYKRFHMTEILCKRVRNVFQLFAIKELIEICFAFKRRNNNSLRTFSGREQ